MQPVSAGSDPLRPWQNLPGYSETKKRVDELLSQTLIYKWFGVLNFKGNWAGPKGLKVVALLTGSCLPYILLPNKNRLDSLPKMTQNHTFVMRPPTPRDAVGLLVYIILALIKISYEHYNLHNTYNTLTQNTYNILTQQAQAIVADSKKPNLKKRQVLDFKNHVYSLLNQLTSERSEPNWVIACTEKVFQSAIKQNPDLSPKKNPTVRNEIMAIIVSDRLFDIDIKKEVDEFKKTIKNYIDELTSSNSIEKAHNFNQKCATLAKKLYIKIDDKFTTQEAIYKSCVKQDFLNENISTFYDKLDGFREQLQQIIKTIKQVEDMTRPNNPFKEYNPTKPRKSWEKLQNDLRKKRAQEMYPLLIQDLVIIVTPILASSAKGGQEKVWESQIEDCLQHVNAHIPNDKTTGSDRMELIIGCIGAASDKIRRSTHHLNSLSSLMAINQFIILAILGSVDIKINTGEFTKKIQEYKYNKYRAETAKEIKELNKTLVLYLTELLRKVKSEFTTQETICNNEFEKKDRREFIQNHNINFYRKTNDFTTDLLTIIDTIQGLNTKNLDEISVKNLDEIRTQWKKFGRNVKDNDKIWTENFNENQTYFQ